MGLRASASINPKWGISILYQLSFVTVNTLYSLTAGVCDWAVDES